MAKYILTFLLGVHGLIHLSGFAKAFQFGNITQLTQEISRTSGVAWLITSLLFLTAALLYITGNRFWCLSGIIAVLFSQALIVLSWQDARFGTIANVIILLFVIIGFGTWKYYQSFISDVKINLSQKEYYDNSPLSENDIKDLPGPVKKYLHYTKSLGKPKVNSFKVEFSGKIRKNEESEWMPFTSEQYNFMCVPTRLFFMKAVMKKLPVGGYHRFINGKAFMDIRLFSLFRVRYLEGDDMNIAETVTFFNDMCFMAPPTLIDKRISWLETEGNNVKAAFTNNNITISAFLYFNDKGELVNFTSDDRYDAGAGKKLQWSTPVTDFKEIKGYKLGRYAETIYSYPDRDLVYGTFTLEDVAYNLRNPG